MLMGGAMCPYLASFRQADNDDGDGDASENDSCGIHNVDLWALLPSMSSQVLALSLAVLMMVTMTTTRPIMMMMMKLESSIALSRK